MPCCLEILQRIYQSSYVSAVGTIRAQSSLVFKEASIQVLDCERRCTSEEIGAEI